MAFVVSGEINRALSFRCLVGEVSMYKYQPDAEMRNMMLVKHQKLVRVDLRRHAGKWNKVYSTVFGACGHLSLRPRIDF